MKTGLAAGGSHISDATPAPKNFDQSYRLHKKRRPETLIFDGGGKHNWRLQPSNANRQKNKRLLLAARTAQNTPICLPSLSTKSPFTRL
jgi:hypothetical protein